MQDNPPITPTPTDLDKIFGQLEHYEMQVEGNHIDTDIAKQRTQDLIQAEIDRSKLKYAVELSILDQEIMSLKAEIVKARDEALEKVDRFEVIDETGRAYVKGSIYGSPVKVELSYQDDDRTLKVFVTALKEGLKG